MITCLLPARNAERDLPGYLESAALFADALIALDDGSTDATAELLEGSPLVTRLLRNPPRPSSAGWHDGANRQRLLDAAIEQGGGWVVFLDADERIDADDADVLRSFVAEDAIPACAYGLQLFRAWEEDRVDPEPGYVFRVFAAATGQALERRPLHLNPVPTQIPRRAWLPTTIRARHLDSPDRLAARRAKYAEADPEGEWERGAGFAEPPAATVPWTPRPTGLPALAPGEEEAAAPTAFPAPSGPLLACLLPARNAERDVPGYLAAAGEFADAVLALDDGSSDATAELLERSALVTRLRRNPPRESYAGWNDAANRQRLLEAARDLGARWVLQLDADERIDPDDGAALRRFLASAADPGCAYGMRVFRMIEDERHYDRAELWVYRLFAAGAAGRLPDRELHLVPVPDSIPRSAWRKTTVRIKHLGSLTDARRHARLAKYREADPDLRWQRDYDSLVAEPGPLRRWRERPPGFPLLADRGAGGAEADLEALDLDAPILSAVVIARNSEDRIEASLRSVVEQDCPVPFEVIAAVSGQDRTAAIVRERFPQVRLVEVPEPGLPGMARNAGVAVARGDYVSFPGSHVVLPQGSLAIRARAHESGWPLVTGSVLNGTPTAAGWASYLLDNSSALPGRPSGELMGAPARCSYAREALLEVGGFPEHMRAGEDTVVNNELWRRGYRGYRERDLVLTHRSPCRSVSRLVSHHFTRGRAFGQILLAASRGDSGGRLRMARRLAAYPAQRVRDTRERVARWGDDELRRRYRRVRPLVALGALAAGAGALSEIFGRRSR